MMLFVRSMFAATLCLFTLSVAAQTTDSLSLVPSSGSHPATVKQKRAWVAPTIKLMSANLLPFSVNYFIRKKSFSFVSLQSIATNLHPKSWEWDTDKFSNNQFAHPYHGSLYFNAFRSEGFSFWQSVPAAFTGSLLWEIAGESDKPAINDLINTTFGGITWGEMTHRFAQRLAHNWRTGRRKNMLDAMGIMVDPMKGASHLLAGRKPQTAGPTDTTKIQFEFSAGSRLYYRAGTGEKQESKEEWFNRLNLVYGSEHGELKTPFSFFSVMVEAGNSDSAFFNIAQIRGNVWGWNLQRSAGSRHIGLVTLEYDYYRNTAFSYGMQTARFSVVSETSPVSTIHVQASMGANLIGLAAVSVDNPYDREPRNYDYASGVGVGGGGNVLLFDRLNVRTNLRINWLTTLDGRNSHYRVFSSNSSLRYIWRQRIFVAYDWGHFILYSQYQNSPFLQKHTYYKRLALGYQFAL
jgi:hypothetical protein